MSRRRRTSRSPIALVLVAALLAPLPAAAAEDESAPRDAFHPPGAAGYAPMGVRGARVLRKGEFELGFTYVHDDFVGNRDNTHRVDEDEVRAAGFPLVALRLDRDEFRVTALWAPFERLTLRASLPYAFTEMQQHAPDGTSFTTRTRGIGDLEVSAVVPFMEYRGQAILLDLGMAFPTGDISLEDVTPFGRSRVSYPQRLGSGSFQAMPGVVYRGFSGPFGWGAQIGGTLALNRNHLDYRLGNRVEVSAWGAFEATPWLSGSLRLGYDGWENVSGQDAGLPPFSQTADPNQQAGMLVYLAPGVNLAVPFLGGQRLGVEAELPVFQSLDGPQLEHDWRLLAGWQWTF